MKLKRNIYIHLETQVRELDSHLLLSLFLINHGFRVYIGNFFTLKILIQKKKNKEGIFITKGGLHIEDCILVKRKCEFYIVIDQELSYGLGKESYRSMIKSRYSDNIVKYIDKFYCLNKEIADISSKIYFKNKAIASGWPRNDLINSEFVPLYKNEVSFLKKKYKKFILFNSDFGSGIFPLYKLKLLYHSFYKNFPDFKKLLIKQYSNNFYFEDFNNFKNFLFKLKDLKNLPNIVFRPHPSEKLEIWKEICNISNKFYIETPDYNASSIILASTGVLHRGCTTAFNAIIYKKKNGYLNLTNKINKNYFGFRKTLYSNSYRIHSVKDFFNWLKQKPNLSKFAYKFKNKLNIRKKYASQNIVHDLNLLKVSSCENHKKLILLNFIEINYLSLKNKIYNFFIYIGLKKERNLFAYGISPKIKKNFNQLYLQSRINLINRLLMKNHRFNLKNNCKVREISNHLFEIDY
jgi:surface carbohydrate biosynthesis protein